MGLLDGLSFGLTAATKAAAGHEQGALAGSQLMRAIMMQQAQLAKEEAETDLTRARTTGQTRQNMVPLFGSPEYNQAKAGETSAVEGARSPYVVGNAVETARRTAPIHVQEAVDTANGTLPAKERLARTESDLTEGRESRLIPQRVAAQANSASLSQSGAKTFIAQNKALVDGVNNYAQAKAAFAEAKAGNPAALKSALLSFASVADPKAQLRQGVMNYVTQVDPSFHGTFEMAVNRLASGKLPSRIIDDMERLVDRVHQTNQQLYEQRRAAYVSRLPSTDPYIPTSDVLFTVPGTSAAHGATPSSNPFADLVPKGTP